jgi:hypothetical protein
LGGVACYSCFWCQSLSLSCNVADNYWPLDEMLPVRQGGLQKCVCCEYQVAPVTGGAGRYITASIGG